MSAPGPQPAQRPECRVLITQLNPFEDVPGYQYAQLLSNDPDFKLALCDDSAVVVTLLSDAGYEVTLLPHPHTDCGGFRSGLLGLLDRIEPALVVPGSDAHLFSIAKMLDENSRLALVCPPARWLAERQIFNKWDLQCFIGRFVPTPYRWRFLDSAARAFLRDQGRLMMKGVVKEARLIGSADEEAVWSRQLLANPANQGVGGGVYYEEYLDGPEHCLLLVKQQRQCWRLGLQKLAATKSGTTMVGEIEDGKLCPFALAELENELGPGMPLELEWRDTADGSRVFEANFRFPSWVGAVGPYGEALVRASTAALAGRPPVSRAPRPRNGTRIVRLPHSGTFGRPGSEQSPAQERRPLWRTASPHQFLIK